MNASANVRNLDIANKIASTATLFRKYFPDAKVNFSPWDNIRENELFERLVNITNHARTHKCSAYCWIPKQFSQKYDEEKHKKVKSENRYTKMEKNA